MECILRYGATENLTFGVLHSSFYAQKQLPLPMHHSCNAQFVQTRCQIEYLYPKIKLMLVAGS